MGLVSLCFLLVSPDIPLSELKKNYTNEFSSFVSVQGMDVHYRDEGEGPVIILLHGTGSSLHTWDKWTKILSENYRVIRLDLPAYGLTGPHPQKKYALDDYRLFLEEFCKKLKLNEFMLAGNSLGGAIAWYYTSFHQDQVSQLHLLNPGGFITKRSPIVFKLAKTPILNKILRYVTPRSFIKMNLKEVYYDDSKLTNEKIETYRDLILRENNRQSFIDRANVNLKEQTGRLKLIQTPTLILWGRQDAWIPVSNSILFKQLLPNSEVVIMDETGHIPMEEKPVESLEIVIEFINKNK
jgi:pimeloyl-ACP methyl ester carboxylesterase